MMDVLLTIFRVQRINFRTPTTKIKILGIDFAQFRFYTKILVRIVTFINNSELTEVSIVLEVPGSEDVVEKEKSFGTFVVVGEHVNKILLVGQSSNQNYCPNYLYSI